MSSRISLSDLLAAGVLIRPAESAAIVAEVCARITRGELRGVPSIHVLRVSNTGEIFAEGPITAHRATVARAAQLLEDLIAPADAAPEFRAPGPLRLALLRARGGVDLPPFPGLDAFAAAVARFAPAEPSSALRELYDRAHAALAAPAAEETALLPASADVPFPVSAAESGERELTISDIRRARRATGLTLREVSERSRIPPALLRELEWGYLWNWPGGLYGRTQLVRYARAANLDEGLVIEVAWPMLQTVINARGGDAVRLIPAEESLELLLAPPALPPVAPSLHAIDVVVEPLPRRRSGLLLATAAAAALVVGPAAFWLHSHRLPVIAAAGTPASSDVALSTPKAPAVAEAQKQTAPFTTPANSGRTATVPVNRVSSSGPSVGAAAAREVPAAAVNSPEFSNEGGAVFFRQDEDEDGHSALVRADGAPRGTVLKITRVLDDKAHNFHARPSPDGRRVAFDSDRDGTRAVFVADQDGHNVRRLSGDGFAALPSWSPDGGQVAFVKAETNRPSVWNLWVADLRTGAQRQVTFNTTGEPWGVSWFPDGRRIAYGRDDALVVQDLEGNDSRRYRSPIPGRLLRMPAVSPDGRRIIFQVSGDGAWLLNLGNGSMRKVLDDPTAGEYSWAPDGHRVAFHSRRSGGWGVWVMGE